MLQEIKFLLVKKIKPAVDGISSRFEPAERCLNKKTSGVNYSQNPTLLGLWDDVGTYILKK